MSRIEWVAMCRGEGYGYVLIASGDLSLKPYARAHTTDGRFVPCKLVPDGCAGDFCVSDERRWVLVLPLIDRDIEACVFDREKGSSVLLGIPFNVLRSKVNSRLLTKRAPELAARMRGIESRRDASASPIVVSGAWRMADGSVVWRVHVRFAMACPDATPRMSVHDASGHALADSCLVLEDQIVPSTIGTDGLVREVTFSVRLPEVDGCFYFLTSLGGKDENSDFKVIHPRRLHEYWRDFGRYPAGAFDAECYEQWFLRQECPPDVAAGRRGSVHGEPHISVVLASAAGFSEETIRTILDQTYASWELLLCSNRDLSGEELSAFGHDDRCKVAVDSGCSSLAELEDVAVSRASGDFVAFLDNGDLLEPDALEAFARAVQDDSRAEFLYCDEDAIEGCRLCRPAIKPAPNLAKIRAYDYVGRLQVMSVDLLRRIGPVPANLAAARAYHRALRAFELADRIVQVTRILYHARSCAVDGEACAAGRRALEAHLSRTGASATVVQGPVAGTYRVRYALPETAPLVSVVIPSKDHLELLRSCVDSILEKTTYPNYEVLIVENNSERAETFSYYEKLVAQDERVRVTTWKPERDGQFNYSAIVNHGAREARGDLLLFLNNDTDVISPEWIEEMVGALAQRPEVAVVGAKLVFPDGLTQHAGMAFNPNGYFMHLGETTPADLVDHDYNVALPHDSTMVTGACQLVRRSVFEELGGYDEELAVAFNDGDFCLRARDAGYEVTYTPYAELHHKEFSSRGREATDKRHHARFLREYAHLASRHAHRFVLGDPTLNPNFSQWDAQFRLR